MLFYFYGNYPSLVTPWTDGWVSVVKDDWLALSVFPLIVFATQPFSSNSSVQCCGSGMFIPDPNFLHPGSEFFPSRIPVWKFDPVCSSLSRIADPDPDFLPISGSRIRGVKKAPDPGSATLLQSIKGTGYRPYITTRPFLFSIRTRSWQFFPTICSVRLFCCHILSEILIGATSGIPVHMAMVPYLLHRVGTGTC